jgi:hypothetical protein
MHLYFRDSNPPVHLVASQDWVVLIGINNSYRSAVVAAIADGGLPVN